VFDDELDDLRRIQSHGRVFEALLDSPSVELATDPVAEAAGLGLRDSRRFCQGRPGVLWLPQ